MKTKNTLENKVIDLSILLNYFKKLSEAMDLIFPPELSLEEIVANHYVDLSNYRHPDWVEAYFPLVMLHHREKAGKLRKSKKLEIMYQNNFNVLSQVVWTAEDFGLYYRKNSHKGFSNIVAAIQADENDFEGMYTDMQKPKKYKNFAEFSLLHDPEDMRLKIMCEVLDEHYACDSTGQLRML